MTGFIQKVSDDKEDWCGETFEDPESDFGGARCCDFGDSGADLSWGGLRVGS
jgi:hypothetical protein